MIAFDTEDFKQIKVITILGRISRPNEFVINIEIEDEYFLIEEKYVYL